MRPQPVLEKLQPVAKGAWIANMCSYRLNVHSPQEDGGVGRQVDGQINGFFSSNDRSLMGGQWTNGTADLVMLIIIEA